MSISVNRKQLKLAIEGIVKAQEHGIRIPALIHGVHGIGKTEIVKQVAEGLGYQCVCLYLSMQEPSDLLGLPSNQEDGDELYTAFSEPDWLHKAKQDPRPAIFFLDEINRAPLMVQQVMLPFTLSGTIHTHSIREHDIVVGAMNPDSADYAVETMDDLALLSRFAHFYAEPTVKEWVEFCKEAGVHSALLSSMNIIGPLVQDIKVPTGDRVIATPDRRNLFKIGMMMAKLPEKVVRKLGPILFPAMVGKAVATQLMEQFKRGVEITGIDVINGVHTVDTLDNAIDMINLANEALISELMAEEHYTMTTVDDDDIFNKNITFNFTSGQFDNICAWVNSLTTDMRYSFIYQLKYKLLQCFDDGDMALFMMAIADNVGLNALLESITYATDD
jgi:hypothetical protein